MREFDVARNEPDPRGWAVVSRDGRAIGEVRDLLIDTERMAATFLDVALDRKRFGLRDDDDSHVLVPVERAHQAGKRLLVEEITPDWVNQVRMARDADQCNFFDRWWRGAA
jgi:sporulation protein YlmC with PRC-barrel domain